MSVALPQKRQSMARLPQRAMAVLPKGTIVILPPRLTSDMEDSSVRILSRSNPRNGPPTYTLQLGSVTIPDVGIHEIFDQKVSPEALELFENEQFRRDQAADAAREQAVKAQRIKSRELQWLERNIATSSEGESRSEGSTSMNVDDQKSRAKSGSRGRPRPNYTHFYPPERAKRGPEGRGDISVEIHVESPKRGPGRPANAKNDMNTASLPLKRGPGRPRKTETSPPRPTVIISEEPSNAKRRKLAESSSRNQSSSTEASSSRAIQVPPPKPLPEKQTLLRSARSASMSTSATTSTTDSKNSAKTTAKNMSAADPNTIVLGTLGRPSTSIKSPPKFSMQAAAINAAPSSPCPSSSSESYDVETILSHHLSDPATHSPDMGGKPIMLYQVKWVGYAEVSWEPADSFEDVRIVKEYWDGVKARGGVVAEGF